MSGFWSPKVSNLSTAKNSVAGLLQIMRRVPFVIEDTFTFKSYEPNLNFNGMGMAGAGILSNYRFRYLKIWKFLFLSFDFTAPLSAPFSNVIYMDLPEGLTVAGADLTSATSITSQQSFPIYTLESPVADNVGMAIGLAGESKLSLSLYADQNYSSKIHISGNGFLEVN